MLFDITLHFITHKTAGFCWHAHTEVWPSSIQSNPKTRALSVSMPAAGRACGRCRCARIQPRSASPPRAEVRARGPTGPQLNIPPRTVLAVCKSLSVRPDVGISINKPGRPPPKLRNKKQFEFDGQKGYHFSVGSMCYPGNPGFVGAGPVTKADRRSSCNASSSGFWWSLARSAPSPCRWARFMLGCSW